MAVNKIDPKTIFASEAPTQDTPAIFNNKTVGWGESRKNGGRPTIKQMNALQQETDLKILWLNENAVAPYDATIDYPNNAVTIKDGTFKIFNGTSWSNFLDKSSVGLSNVDDTSDLNKPISTAVKTKLDYIDKNGAALPHKEGIVYEENAVVVKDGELQQWKSGEWVDVVGDIDASFVVYDGVNQKTINDGLDSIAEMLAIASPQDGMRVYVKSYHAGLRKGGGYFIYDSAKASTNDTGVVINGWVRQLEVPPNPYHFGAYGDWSATAQTGHDDSVPFQKCIDYILANYADYRRGNSGRQLTLEIGSYLVGGLRFGGEWLVI